MILKEVRFKAGRCVGSGPLRFDREPDASSATNGGGVGGAAVSGIKNGWGSGEDA